MSCAATSMRHNLGMETKVPPRDEKRESHGDKWVVRASTSGKFLAAADTLKEALEKSSAVKEKKSISKVIPQIYAGACL